MRTLVASICLLALLASIGVQRRFYAVCAMDGISHWTACCNAKIATTDAPVADHAPCCTWRPFASLVAANVQPAPHDVDAVAQLAYLPPFFDASSSPPLRSSTPPPSKPRLSRAGPAPPRRLPQRLALLSVLMT